MRLYPEGASQEALLMSGLPGDLDWHTLVLKHLAPGLGCVIAFIMFFSPFTAVRQVARNKQLGDFNPLPLVAIIANCLVWLVYGSFTRDPYVIMANEPGLMLGVYMTVTAYGFADPKVKGLMLKAILFFAALISVTSICISLFITGHDAQVQAAGYQAVGVLLIYYAAPLSALAQVLSSRSSASLYWPLSVMSCVNGGLWVAYGLAVGDAFIWAPNSVGAFFGVVQLGLIAVFPARKASIAVAAGLAEEGGVTEPMLIHT